MILAIDFFILGFKHQYLNAWFGGMYHSFFKALEEAGCRVTYNSDQPNLDADVLVVQVGGNQDQINAQAMQAFKGPVVLNVGTADYWFHRDFLDRWDDRILFANRLFDPAMAGCFQVSNAPQVVRQYFGEKQVVAVDPVDKRVETILHYLNHPKETEPHTDSLPGNGR